MAAGAGSRYGSLKQFDELGPSGEFLLEYSIFDAIRNGFDHVVLVTREDRVDELYAYIRERIPETVKLDVVAQKLSDIPEGVQPVEGRTKPWGTVHAVWVARDVVKDDFIVINADDFYGEEAFVNSSKFIDDEMKPDMAGLVPYNLKDTLSKHGSVSRGVCNFNGEELTFIEEYIKLENTPNGIIDANTGEKFTGEELVSMNFWIFEPGIFGHMETYMKDFLSDPEKVRTTEAYLPKMVYDLIKSDKITVKGTEPASSWFGVTYASDKDKTVAHLTSLTKEQVYPSPLWKN